MKKRVKRKFNVVKFILFLFILIILYLLINYLLNVKTKNIIILNNNYYSDEEVIEASNISDYPKFILLNKSKIKNKLKKLDLIEDVEIKKHWGYILEINIKEKKVLYYVRSIDKYKTSDGNLYDLNNMVGIPILINFVPEEIEKSFVDKFKEIDSNIISRISEIEYSKTTYDEKRFLLYMNDGNEVYITISKLSNLNKYTEIVKKIGNKKGILYLDSGNYFEIKEK